MMAIRILLISFFMIGMISGTESKAACVKRVFRTMRIICENAEHAHIMKQAYECCDTSCTMAEMWTRCHQ